mmetsp:Transcript_4845/g.12100  ORF Transcript_4845/g.12100 Transcript_4845/m.12100 type:complete len:222 (-) Transcript_4845:241-906(-)
MRLREGTVPAPGRARRLSPLRGCMHWRRSSRRRSSATRAYAEMRPAAIAPGTLSAASWHWSRTRRTSLRSWATPISWTAIRPPPCTPPRCASRAPYSPSPASSIRSRRTTSCRSFGCGRSGLRITAAAATMMTTPLLLPSLPPLMRTTAWAAVRQLWRRGRQLRRRSQPRLAPRQHWRKQRRCARRRRRCESRRMRWHAWRWRSRRMTLRPIWCGGVSWGK